MASHYQRGAARERQVAKRLQDQGYVVVRGAGSKSVDLLALCPAIPTADRASQVLFIEVKATKAGPFSDFGPAARAELKEKARKGGGVPVLIWWPAGGKESWFFESEWPDER